MAKLEWYSLGIAASTMLILTASAEAAILDNNVDATNCAIAIGGGVGASKITNVCGIPPELLNAIVQEFKKGRKNLQDLANERKATVDDLRKILSLNDAQLRTALETLGEKDVHEEQLLTRIVEIAQRFNSELKTAAEPQQGDNSTIAALKQEIQEAIDQGDLKKADSLLAQVQDEQLHSLDSIAIAAAETISTRGDVSLTRLDYKEAAKFYAKAALLLSTNDQQGDKRFTYLMSEAEALYKQGDEFGDNHSLVAAIECYQYLFHLADRNRMPLNWAMTQAHLGKALKILGERESGTARLEEAVIAYRAALEEFTRDRVPLLWATMQSNLGNLFSTLGERESGTARPEEAVAAYRAALEENTRDRAPLLWATMQNNLGGALLTLGERESGTARLEEAVAVFRAALQERTRDRMPLQWAMTQNNLGGALLTLGERESGTARLEEAVAAYRAALQERTRDKGPLQWAETQNNLGAALKTLGERESGTARLEEAVAVFRAALQERTRDRVPLKWATTQNNLGAALKTLGERESGTARLEEAVAAYRAALEENTHNRVPLQWTETQSNLRTVLEILESRRE